MRSFAGLYFVVQIMLLCTSIVGGVVGVAYIVYNDPFFFWRNIVLTMAVLLIAICRPYQKMYMNISATEIKGLCF